MELPPATTLFESEDIVLDVVVRLTWRLQRLRSMPDESSWERSSDLIPLPPVSSLVSAVLTNFCSMLPPATTRLELEGPVADLLYGFVLGQAQGCLQRLGVLPPLSLRMKPGLASFFFLTSLVSAEDWQDV